MSQPDDYLEVRDSNVSLRRFSTIVLDFPHSVRTLSLRHDGVSLSSDSSPRPRDILRVGSHDFKFACSESSHGFSCVSEEPVDELGSDADCYGDVEVWFDTDYKTFDVYFSGTCRVFPLQLTGYVFKDYHARCSSQRTLGGRDVYVCDLKASPKSPDINLSYACNYVSDLYGVDLRKCEVSDDGSVHITAVVDPDEADLSTYGYDPEDYLVSAIVANYYTQDDLRDFLSRDLDVPKEDIVINYGESPEYPFEDEWHVHIYAASDEPISENKVLQALRKAEELFGISLA